MIPLAQPLACEQARLEQVVTKAFSQRRKVIRNCLAGMFTENDLIDAGVIRKIARGGAVGAVCGAGESAQRRLNQSGLRSINSIL